MLNFTGSCLCGNIRFSISAEPVGAGYCWCRDCQRIASGSATVNAYFPEDSVSYEGKIETSKRVADSGNIVERGFCGGCGSQMYSRTETEERLPIRVRMGTLDDPEISIPNVVYWVDSAPSWATFPSGLPLYAKGPGSNISEKRRM